MTNETQCAANTDREIWREREGDYYADSIHITESGGIGIKCGGFVIVKPIREWFRAAIEANENSNLVMDENGHITLLERMTEAELLRGLEDLGLGIPDQHAKMEQG